MSDLYVFGYGSLMWNPGFDHVESMPGKVIGVHRAPCIYSWVHRGTRQRPGIVLGLARGGSCRGVVFRIDPAKREDVLDYLRARELVTNVYLETERKVHLADGKGVTATTFVADPRHEQYAGHLSLDALIHQIRGAVGRSGDNESYILDTCDHMAAIGIRDRLMEAVARELRAR